MTNFNQTCLTEAGRRLFAREGNQSVFTRVETGCGEYVENEDVCGMSCLKQKVQDIAISSVSAEDDTTVRLKFIVSNVGLEESYLFTEIGVYANDPVCGEILYAVCYAAEDSAEKILQYNGVFSATVIISLLISVADSSKVTFKIEGIYALIEDLEEFKRQKGVSNGLAELDENGLVPSSQLPAHPAPYQPMTSGLYKITTDACGHIVKAVKATKEDITDLGIPAQDTNTTYEPATTSTAGLMSAADKEKLNGIDTGANKTTIDSALKNSTNPVQNKVVKNAIDEVNNHLSNTASKTVSSGESTYVFQNADVRFGSRVIVQIVIGNSVYTHIYVVTGSSSVAKIYESGSIQVSVSVSNNKLNILVNYPGYTMTATARIIY